MCVSGCAVGVMKSMIGGQEDVIMDGVNDDS